MEGSVIVGNCVLQLRVMEKSGGKWKVEVIRGQGSDAVKLQATHRRKECRRHGILITPHKRSAVWGTKKHPLRVLKARHLKR